MIGGLGSSISHSLAQSLNPAPTLCVLGGCSSRFGIYYTPRASSAVKASVSQGKEIRATVCEEPIIGFLIVLRGKLKPKLPCTGASFGRGLTRSDKEPTT